MSHNAVPPADVDDRQFARFRDFLTRESGIHLATNKKYLLSTRLKKILTEYGFANFKQLNDALADRGGSQLKQQVVDAMTTNETFWFRDTYPFDFLLKSYFATGNDRNLRIWCAACSSGQEPYSLAILANEAAASRGASPATWLNIQATDISLTMIRRCQDGIYSSDELSRGMSSERIKRFFEPTASGDLQVNGSIRDIVQFKQLNLLDNFDTQGKFDVIFCRNVLIYFDANVKADILRRLHARLNPGGILFLGASESVGAVGDLFTMVHCQPGIGYRAAQ